MPMILSTIEIERRRAHATIVGTMNSTGIVVSPTDLSASSSRELRAYIKQALSVFKLFTFPEQLSATIKYEYFSWLAAYTDSNTEDYLLKYGHDVLLWESLSVANMFLAEENRVMIDAQASQIALQELMSQDNQVTNAPIDVS
jgi:hypothetical protein